MWSVLCGDVVGLARYLSKVKFDVPDLKVSHRPSETLPDALYYLGNRETSQMLTKTSTVITEISPQEKIALDTQKVCEAFIQAYEAGDRQNALQYAKVVMLKAMSLWGFPQPVETVENSKSQKVKNLTFLVFWIIENLRFLSFLSFSVFLSLKR
mgnify:FL=1